MDNKCSYNKDKLLLFAKNNNIILIGDYKSTTRNTIITGNCKTENCTNNFNKNFRSLMVYNSYFCNECMIKIKVNKTLFVIFFF